jgi:hypothetical protein
MIKTQKGGKKGANYGWTIGGSTRQGLGVCSTFGAASCLLLKDCKHVLLRTYQQLVACASMLSIALLIHRSCMYSKHQPAQNIHYYSLFWEPLSRRAIDYLQCYQCNTKHSTTDKPTGASQWVPANIVFHLVLVETVLVLTLSAVLHLLKLRSGTPLLPESKPTINTAGLVMKSGDRKQGP